MQIATWNVNSIRARLPRVLEWLERVGPDVVCLQETKVRDDQFPVAEMAARGYHALVFGQPTYNGVAILSRAPTGPVFHGFPGDDGDQERRLIATTINGITVVCVYVPNGREVGSPTYEHKLAWIYRLRSLLNDLAAPGDLLAVCGDFNVAPGDGDVHDPDRWRGQLLCSQPERTAFEDLLEWGLVDVLRHHHPGPGPFTWWDYRGGAFHRDWGLRIDHVLATKPLAERCAAVETHRDERKGERPSDHVPVVATFAGG